MQNTLTVPSTHYPELDGFRGIAVLAVVLVHCRQIYVASKFDVILSGVMSFGMHGVDLFFVLSGFLITGILLRSKNERGYFSKFYTRRALRIFPLYYLYLILRLILLPIVANHTPLLQGSLSEWQPHSIWVWLYGTNIAPMALSGGVFHLWSLAVEEQFYLFWPLAVYFSSRRTFERLCIAAVIIAPLLRLLAISLGQFPLAYGFTLCRMDSLVMGALVALFQARLHSRMLLMRLSKPMVLAGIAIPLVYFAIHGQWDTKGAFTLTVGVESASLCGVGIIVMLLNGQNAVLTQMCSSRILRSFGKYSYGIYIWHFLLIRICDKLLQRKVHLPSILGSLILCKATFVATAIMLSYAVAWLSWNVYEQYFLKLKKYFEYRGAGYAESIRQAGTVGVRVRASVAGTE